MPKAGASSAHSKRFANGNVSTAPPAKSPSLLECVCPEIEGEATDTSTEYLATIMGLSGNYIGTITRTVMDPLGNYQGTLEPLGRGCEREARLVLGPYPPGV